MGQKSQRSSLARVQRWVVKVGSALVTGNGSGLDRECISAWADQIAGLRKAGRQVTVVSSGAVAEGVKRLGWQQRPRAVYQLQAAAALGQSGLVSTWSEGFAPHHLMTAQVLLTHDDLSDRRRYLNARSALREMLRLGIIPIVNENDTVVTDEIRFGDNDTLAALVANLVEAQGLLILTDQPGMMDSDPRDNPQAGLICEARAGDPGLERLCGVSPGELGRGGMLTKVRAAARAARSGAYTVVADGREQQVIEKIAQGEADIGTLFVPDSEPLAARKQWLASHLQVAGELRLDDGAARALREGGKSLLPVGVVGVKGDFSRGDMVVCIDSSGLEVARGLVGYASDEAEMICGRASSELEQVLGYVDEPELIHRDNMVVTG
ncbi:glutamate 5-kinase [Halorhodospira halochloris]|uniref:glutamate 5-kinase n=1 Tax=Halorhodospira halochloris TaxID=1052 RepID=UPI001EE7DB9C|nr:glutamate 5-kinase [Halorhodospira halochloris]MCG5548049.1 glutamate 5-kinase [Halorhodospira halochloris]